MVVTCYKAVTIAKASGSCPKKQTQRDSDIASEFFALKRLSFFIFLLTRSLMAQSQIMAVRLARCWYMAYTVNAGIVVCFSRITVERCCVLYFPQFCTTLSSFIPGLLVSSCPPGRSISRYSLHRYFGSVISRSNGTPYSSTSFSNSEDGMLILWFSYRQTVERSLPINAATSDRLSLCSRRNRLR